MSKKLQNYIGASQLIKKLCWQLYFTKNTWQQHEKKIVNEKKKWK